MKVLNLYAGIGGNRANWKNVEVTALENNKRVASVYQDFFPDDEVIIGDAHKYLLENFDKYDFIWASPPCATHSRMRYYVGSRGKGYNCVYPDMSIYQEIILLQYNAKCKWVVENVSPYYDPLIKPTIKMGRHYFWANFEIIPLEIEPQNLRMKNRISQVEELHNLNLSKYEGINKRLVLRNYVDKRIGEHILNCAFSDSNSPTA